MTYINGEQKGVRFVDFPVHDSSYFLSDMPGKGKFAIMVWNHLCQGGACGTLWPMLTEIVAFVILPKVREPVVCPNQHVFCSNCMDTWLRSHSFCPTCRTSITAEQPCKKIIGKEKLWLSMIQCKIELLYFGKQRVGWRYALFVTSILIYSSSSTILGPHSRTRLYCIWIICISTWLIYD